MHRVRARLAGSACLSSVAFLALLFALAAPVAADDTTPPTGTLTINDGSGSTNDLHLTLHIPATDDVGVVSVVVSDSTGYNGDPIPYAETVEHTLADVGDGDYIVAVEWIDAAGNWTLSEQVHFSVDRVAPAVGVVSFVDYSEEKDAVRSVQVDPLETWDPLAFVRFSSNGTTWSPRIPWSSPVDWSYLDPALGGSPRLGSRTLYVQGGDLAGNWSSTKTKATVAAPRAPLSYSPDDPSTGHKLTLTPGYAADVTFPAGTECMWEVAWGDDASLYHGDHNDTFGFFMASGPASGGFCDALSFTLPWIAFPQMLVHYEVQLPGTDAEVDEWIGSSPNKPSIDPAIDSTDRHIASSNLPLIYVLPEDYTLVLGQPTTYKAYTVGGATLGAHDVWLADFSSDANDIVREGGGASFTFTPHETGYVTVCINTDTSKSRRWSACYDPPVRVRDRWAPTAKAPVPELRAATAGDTVASILRWDGRDQGWGIAKYQVERSIDGHAWHRILSRKTKHLDVSLAPGHAYRYRVRAIDKAGHRGDWKVGPTVRPKIIGDASPGLSYGGAWTAVADATALGGSLKEADSSSASATFRFTGRDVGWIAERGPTHGKAKVYVDGKLISTVDLTASTDQPRRVVFRRHWGAAGDHRIKVVVVGTAGRPTVDVDGFLVLR